MEKYKCKLSSRKFINGRALGGHMKSHIMNLPSSSSSSTTFSSSSFYDSDQEKIFDDKTSEIESFKKNPSGKRSKTKRVILKSYDDQVKEVKSDEDLAICLMMMSRDTRSNSIKKKIYKCETCDKVFRSYQALGGHRASHKKNRVIGNNLIIEEIKEMGIDYDDENEKKIYECPICLRVFSSGQALGGHKRSHGVLDYSPRKKIMVINTTNQRLIDLNLPAPLDFDDDQQQISQIHDHDFN
ncbi:unnamed protein product [Amaranthus hypochondriacus]